ncbi:uncharacterized protein RSE6_11622 [Rhynchosporium secalis]|uniref:Alpha-galactosidase n=1 Tax=Rhynchosporium secalis TaxID=38038 RepID=A0A1E1MNH2_RHYSE|nr:uncharacterized protein RSE6_11622 [Rhynchosporium secalis]
MGLQEPLNVMGMYNASLEYGISHRARTTGMLSVAMFPDRFFSIPQSTCRDQRDNLVIDTKKFPSGMNAVTDEIHRQGMSFGMYSSAGEMLCARYAGSLDHETNDANSFAAWGADYLKSDNCYHMGRFGTPKISFDR